MVVALAIVVGVLLGSTTGGHFRCLENLHLRGESFMLILVAAAAVAPRLLTGVGEAHHALVRLVWLSTLLAAATLSLVNHRTPGSLVVAAGLLLNVSVVAANGGMPVALSVVDRIGGGSTPGPRSAFHTVLNSGSRLPWLADILPLPGPDALRAVVSVGDVLLLVGLAILLAVGMRPQISGV